MMLTLTQTLTDYPVSLLRAIADARGLQSLVHAATPAALAVELSAALADPGSIVDAVERLPETAQTLLAALVLAPLFVGWINCCRAWLQNRPSTRLKCSGIRG